MEDGIKNTMRVGYSDFYISIFHDEEIQEPHVHIRFVNKEDACISLLSNNYIKHNFSTSMLTKRQRKSFNELSHKVNNNGFSFHQTMIEMWNTENPNYAVDYNNMQVPNYEEIL